MIFPKKTDLVRKNVQMLDARIAETEAMGKRLAQIERVLSEREWLAADRFTVADLIMADVLRITKVRAHGDRPATEAYIERLIGRPAFRKAHVDQMAHFAASDKTRTKLE